MGEFKRDVNRDHFERNAQFDAEVPASCPPICIRSFWTSSSAPSRRNSPAACCTAKSRAACAIPTCANSWASWRAMRRGTRVSSTKRSRISASASISGFLRRDKKYTHFRAEIHLLRHLPVREDRLRALHHDLPAPGEASGEALSSRYFAGSSAGATMSSATARLLRCIMRANPHSAARAQQALDPLLPAGGLRDHVRARSRSAADACGLRHGSDGIRFHGVSHHHRDLQAGISAVARPGPSAIPSGTRAPAPHCRRERCRRERAAVRSGC